MQEDVEYKTVNLAIKSSKVSALVLYRGLKAFIDHQKRKHEKKTVEKEEPIKGKQSVKELIGQGQGVSSMPIGENGVRDFKKISNKYGVDFAIIKDKSVNPPQYTSFFKAKDADAITQVLKEYSVKQMKRQEKSSVLQKLKQFKNLVSNTPRKVKEKWKEYER